MIASSFGQIRPKTAHDHEKGAYRYAGDKAPGQAAGNGIEGAWHVIKVS